MELKQKGSEANVGGFKQLMVSMKWTTAADFDLAAAYEAKDGNIGLVYFGELGDLNTLPSVANEITSHGIHLGLYYMLGYPGQTTKDLDSDYNFIKKIPFSRIRTVFATPYPGTKLYEEVKENNLWLKGCEDKWDIFTNDRPVIKTPATPEQLVSARKKVLKLYQSENYQTRMKEMYQGNPQSKRAFDEFQKFLREAIPK